MTTNREQIIAAAKEAGFDVWIESVGPLPFWIERFYAIAFAAGAASRDAEIAELVTALEKQLADAKHCQQVMCNEVGIGFLDVITLANSETALAKVRKP